MRILMITQKFDPNDPQLGFTVSWIKALVSRVELLHVLTLERPSTAALYEEFPPNLRTWSLGKDRGLGRLRMGWQFYRTLLRIINQTDVIFSHMVPRYTWMAAPIAAAYPVPQVLWYTHRQVSRELRWALAVSRRVVTAVPESFPLKSGKVRVLGHGVDADFFSPSPLVPPPAPPQEENPPDEEAAPDEAADGEAPAALPPPEPPRLLVPPDDPPLLVHVARIMPIKYQHTLLHAIARLRDRPYRVALVGAVPPGQSPEYLHYLQQRVVDLGLTDRVIFTGGLPPTAVRDLYRRASVAVNLSPPGLFDKAALESMLVGLPTVTANAAFDSLLGEHVPLLRIADPDDVDGLVNKLDGLLSLDHEQRREMGAGLRQRAAAAHSLDGLMDRLIDVLAELVIKK